MKLFTVQPQPVSGVGTKKTICFLDFNGNLQNAVTFEYYLR